MSKANFMKSLERGLANFDQLERQEIIMDYNEYFNDALKSGKSEKEVCDALGHPKKIIEQFKYTKTVNTFKEDKSVGNFLKAGLAGFSLILFNLIFVVGIYFGLIGVYIALWAVDFSLFITGVSLMISPILKYFAPSAVSLPMIGEGFSLHIEIVFYLIYCLLGVGIFLVGFYFMKLLKRLGKLIIDSTKRYVGANIKIVKRQV